MRKSLKVHSISVLSLSVSIDKAGKRMVRSSGGKNYNIKTRISFEVVCGTGLWAARLQNKILYGPNEKEQRPPSIRVTPRPTGPAWRTPAAAAVIGARRSPQHAAAAPGASLKCGAAIGRQSVSEGQAPGEQQQPTRAGNECSRSFHNHGEVPY